MRQKFQPSVLKFTELSTDLSFLIKQIWIISLSHKCLEVRGRTCWQSSGRKRDIFRHQRVNGDARLCCVDI